MSLQFFKNVYKLNCNVKVLVFLTFSAVISARKRFRLLVLKLNHIYIYKLLQANVS